MAALKYKRIALCIVGVVAVGLALHQFFDKPRRYDIPNGFEGWIVVRFSSSSCPPLPTAGIFQVARISKSGTLCTSTENEHKAVYYKFTYVYSDGRRLTLDWNQHGKAGIQAWLVGYDPELHCEKIFVGAESSMNQSGPPPACP